MNNYQDKWEDSYVRQENNIFHPKEEAVKFINRFICKKLGEDDFRAHNEIQLGKSRGLDFGCGIGTITNLMQEYKVEAHGVDIAKKAIETAQKTYPEIGDRFQALAGTKLPFEDGFFDVCISEAVLDSMPFETALEIVAEISRTTNHFFYFSVISGDDSGHSREYEGEEVQTEKHEEGTVQSYFNWSKINRLLENTGFTIQWAEIHRQISCLSNKVNARYYVVAKKQHLVL